MFDVGEQLRINGPFVAMILAAFVAEAFAVSRAGSSELDRARVEAAVPWVLAAAVVAGRLVFVAREPAVYLERPVDLLIIRSGIDFYGALAGAALVVAWRFPGVRWPALALLALTMLAAVAAQRAGCVLGNHCHGAATDGPLGVPFPGLDGRRYPSQPLEAALAGLLLWALVHAAGRLGPMRIAGLALLGYGVIRFVVEFTRVRVEEVGGLSESQVRAIGLSTVGVVIVISALVRGQVPAGDRRA